MADWPRLIIPLSASKPDWPGALRSKTQAGYVNTRSVAAAGVVWKETYPLLKHGRLDDEALIATIEDSIVNGTIWTATHQVLPGSGMAPNGLGTGGVTVDGAGQSGTTLNLTGFPLSTSNVVRKGDWLGIAGINKRFKFLADANSDGAGDIAASIMPAIWVGEEPGSGSAVTLTGLKFRVSVKDASTFSQSVQAFFWGGVSVTFEERL